MRWLPVGKKRFKGKKQKNYKKTFQYSCVLTGETYETTKKASSEEELLSIEAYYEMNPEMDDRPEHIKNKLKNKD